MEYLFAILYRALVAATPLIIAAQGQILTERSGILNLGVEGIMALGALGAYAAGQFFGPLAGIIASLVLGSCIGLVHAGVTIGLRANQTVSGLAIAMLGTGLASLLGKSFIGKQSLVYINPLVFLILAAILSVLVFLFLNVTKAGLALRTCGEKPLAAESAGIRVSIVRLYSTVAGSGLIGLAGGFLSLSYQSSWIENMTNGRGWLVVALVIFSLWHPLKALIGSFAFSAIFVLQYILQPLGVPPNLLAMLPYLATIVFLALQGIRGDHRSFQAPRALGEAYKRGER